MPADEEIGQKRLFFDSLLGGIRVYFCHLPEIWERFPGLVPGIVVLPDTSVSKPVDSLLDPLMERARTRLDEGPESQMPEISAWRQVYSQMGLKPTQYRSASEALLRRFRLSGDLPRLSPLVDYCNAVSLAYALPVAVIDLDRVDRFLEVRPAVGHEKYLSFKNEIEHPGPGEIIFADASENVHARRWTFRQSLLSVISDQTTRALIISEAMHETGVRDMESLLDEMTSGLSEHFSKPAKRKILTGNDPRLDF